MKKLLVILATMLASCSKEVVEHRTVVEHTVLNTVIDSENVFHLWTVNHDIKKLKRLYIYYNEPNTIGNENYNALNNIFTMLDGESFYVVIDKGSGEVIRLSIRNFNKNSQRGNLFTTMVHTRLANQPDDVATFYKASEIDCNCYSVTSQYIPVNKEYINRHKVNQSIIVNDIKSERTYKFLANVRYSYFALEIKASNDKESQTSYFVIDCAEDTNAFLEMLVLSNPDLFDKKYNEFTLKIY